MESTNSLFTSAERMNSTSRLEQLAREFMYEGQRDFGISGAAVEKAMPNLIDLSAGDFLFQRTLEATGDAHLFETPKSILEIGCGTGPFVYSALLRGHDAHGIDTDDARLAVAHEKISAYSLPSEWKAHIVKNDAAALRYPAGTFDIVLGWQVIEHIPDLSGALFECIRVLKRGGTFAFWAPDYRAPYEAHYELPWPPFAPRYIAEEWVRALGRPIGGIGSFFNITLYQVFAEFEALGCEMLMAKIDRPINLAVSSLIDVSSPSQLASSAARIMRGMADGSLPTEMTQPTSMIIAGRKK